MLRGAAPADAVGEMLVHPVRHQELGICGPTIESLGVSDLVLAQRFAMGFGRVLLVRCAIADMALDDDQRWPAAFPRGEVEGAQHFLLVISIAHMLHVPAIAEEARRHVLGKGDLGVALDA